MSLLIAVAVVVVFVVVVVVVGVVLFFRMTGNHSVGIILYIPFIIYIYIYL